MHKFTHLWPVQIPSCWLLSLSFFLFFWLLSLSDMTSVVHDSYSYTFPGLSSIFPSHLSKVKTQTLLKNFPDSELQGWVSVALHGINLHRTNSQRYWLWMWVCATQHHSHFGPLLPSLALSQALVWAALPALSHVISSRNKSWFARGFSSKDIITQDEAIHYTYPVLNCKWHHFFFTAVKFLWLHIPPSLL